LELKRRAISIAEAHFDNTDARLVRLLSGVAIDLEAIGEYDEARAHLVRALHISEGVQGDGPRTSLLLSHLTDVLLELNRPAEALPYAERALDTEEPRTDELASIGISYACRALGRCLMGVGRNAEAIVCLERSLAQAKVRHPNKKIIFEDEILGWIEHLRMKS
jgi:tetratricopeptide (TPR) repeat protein